MELQATTEYDIITQLAKWSAYKTYFNLFIVLLQKVKEVLVGSD